MLVCQTKLSQLLDVLTVLVPRSYSPATLLKSVSWKSDVGAGSTVNWPKNSVGGKGNDGVAAFVQRLPGSIGYVEYAYAKQNNLVYTKLISADGEAVSPTVKVSVPQRRKLTGLNLHKI